MTITVAGNKKEYEDGLKLTELIEKEDIESPEYVTVTINDEFISKADVPETEVKDGDVVEFLYYMGVPLKLLICKSHYLAPPPM